MILTFSALLLSINVTHPLVKKAEAFHSVGRAEEASIVYRDILKTPGVSRRERALGRMRIFLIEAPLAVGGKKQPPPLDASELNTLTAEDRKELESELYALIRWYTAFRYHGPQLSLARFFLESKPSHLNQVRTWYLLSLGAIARSRFPQAKWYLMRVLEAGEGRTHPRLREVIDLAAINLARIHRLDGQPAEGLLWAQRVPDSSRWIFHATHEAMWNQFELGRKDAAQASAEALALLLETNPGELSLAPGTRDLAVSSALMAGYLQIQKNNLPRARSTYLLALENLRVMRAAISSLRDPRRSLASAQLSGANPFRNPTLNEAALMEWLPSRDVRQLEVAYDDTLRLLRLLSAPTGTVADLRANRLKQTQAQLTEEVYRVKSSALLRRVSLLSLKAQMGMEHIAWQERANRMGLKKDLLMIKSRMMDNLQGKLDEVQR